MDVSFIPTATAVASAPQPATTTRSTKESSNFSDLHQNASESTSADNTVEETDPEQPLQPVSEGQEDDRNRENAQEDDALLSSIEALQTTTEAVIAPVPNQTSDNETLQNLTVAPVLTAEEVPNPSLRTLSEPAKAAENITDGLAARSGEAVLSKAPDIAATTKTAVIGPAPDEIAPLDAVLKVSNAAAELSRMVESNVVSDAQRLETASVPMNANTLVPSAQQKLPTQLFRLVETGPTNTTPQLELEWPANQPPPPPPAQMLVQVQSSTQIIPTLAKMAANSVSADDLRAKSGDSAGIDSIELAPQDARSEQSRSVQTPFSVAATRAELPPGIARQIAEVLQRAPDRAIELQLQPAELGRVRMTISPSEVGIAVSIQTERIETLDLMRRNIEQLELAMTDLGYDDIAFSFGTQTGSETDDQGTPGTNASPLSDMAAEIPEADSTEPVMQSTLRADGRMDVRI